jgi:hypothetical protein
MAPQLRPHHEQLAAALEAAFAPGLRQLLQAAPVIARLASTAPVGLEGVEAAAVAVEPRDRDWHQGAH